jgi:hypothetical protein
VLPVTLSTALLTVFAIELVVLYEFDEFVFEFEYKLELDALPLFVVFAVGSHPVKPSIKPVRNINIVIFLMFPPANARTKIVQNLRYMGWHATKVPAGMTRKIERGENARPLSCVCRLPQLATCPSGP